MCMVPTKKNVQKKNEQGFALLMTLIVVTVVVAIGLTVLDLSTKQIRLSTNAKDSEVAFHAANAGMECARYWRRQASNLMETGGAVIPSCFGVSLYSNARSQITTSVSGDGEVYKYDYSFTWAGDTRCSQITTLVASSTSQGSGLTIGNMASLVPGYPGGALDEKECAAGERCTVLSVRGYNKPCNNASGYGTVQREVLLQF
jgi:type II secretory pathway pseudopilin PulG